MHIKKNFPTIVSTLFLAPALAEASETPETFADLVDLILALINVLIPALFGIVFVVIIWKIIDAWVINGGDATKREEGRRLVLIGVLVFVLMIVTWGVVALLRTAFFPS